jgi:predicted nucleic acid-binding protein
VTGAVICDTSALIDYVVAKAPDHEAFRVALDGARARYVPGLVLAEVDYFLRAERTAMRTLIDDLRRGAFIYAPPTDGQLVRALEVDAAFADLELGLVDGSIVALAEELDVTRLATRNVRDFTAVRLSDGRPFELVVAPTRPDRKVARRRRRR